MIVLYSKLMMSGTIRTMRMTFMRIMCGMIIMGGVRTMVSSICMTVSFCHVTNFGLVNDVWFYTYLFQQIVGTSLCS